MLFFAPLISWLLPLLLLSQSVSSQSSWEDNPFHHVARLDSRGDYILQWTVNWVNRTVSFNATARTTGYVGFGLSAKGKMFGADVVMGGVEPSGQSYFIDMHVPQNLRQPIKDDSQDYILHSSWENGTHTSIAFSRAFETCDPHDYKINDDKVVFIWAYGETDDITQYHYGKRGQYKIYILDPDYTPRAIQEAKRTGHQLSQDELGDVRVWTVTRQQQLTEADTTYWCSFNKGPVLDKKHHIIGFDFRYEDENDIQFRHTHHMILSRCRAPVGEDANQFFQPYVQNNTGEMCYFLLRGSSGDMPTQYCRETIYNYAIGERIFFLPSHTGIPFGDSPDEYYMLQVHYDNPNRLSTLNYTINIDMYYTPNLRENEAGVATIGHQIPASPSILVPPNSLHQSIYGHCGSDCTNEMIPAEGINIVAVQQHTHNSGVRFRFRQFRDGMELPWIFNDDNYDNQFQSVRHPRNEVKVLPGDHLITRCVYDNTWTEGEAVVGGFTTRQEMCLSYIWYYNKMPNYSLCRSEIVDPEYRWKHLGVGNLTWSDPDLEFVVTDPEGLAGLTVGEVATDRIEWTTAKRNELQKDQKEWEQTNQCDSLQTLASIGEGEPKYVEYPSGVTEYRIIDEAERVCRGRGSDKKYNFNYKDIVIQQGKDWIDNE